MLVRTRSLKETKLVAARLAQEIISVPRRLGAIVIALEGNLGAGKTTFVQGFAHALGIKESVLSPTFVLMKIYNVRCQVSGVRCYPKHLIHIDCYRLDSPKDLLHLGFRKLLKDKDAVILIEWADRIRKILPRSTMWVKFKHGRNQHERILRIGTI